MDGDRAAAQLTQHDLLVGGYRGATSCSLPGRYLRRETRRAVRRSVRPASGDGPRGQLAAADVWNLPGVARIMLAGHGTCRFTWVRRAAR